MSHLPLVELVAAMSSPEFHPHRPATVEVRQTHISWVFLAGDRVFKVKKPVSMAFLDYSTLEKRRFWCEEEVRLNRRLAPTVYEGVVPIRRTASGFAFGDVGEIVEFAVAMRRLPDERMLDRLLAARKAGRAEILRIAETMAAFHPRVEAIRDPAIGSPKAIGEIATENLAEATRFRERTISPRRFDALSAFARSFVAERPKLFATRLSGGRLRDGHGDLRAEHACFEESGELSIFDCVEFSPRLRGADVGSEMAFLAMELDFLDEPALARALVEAYAEAAGDPGVTDVQPFYRCYRAAVRGKVESVKSEASEVPPIERRIAEERARRFFALASRYSAPPAPPALVVVCGEIASGKSTLARLVADRTGFAVHSSDRTRKAIAGIGATERSTGAARERLYSPELTERTYAALFDAADRALAAGRGVVLDATFAERKYRARALELASRLGVRPLLVACAADEQTTLARLEERRHRADEASDATAEIYRERRGTFEPFDDVPGEALLAVDTSAGPLPALDALEERLLGGAP